MVVSIDSYFKRILIKEIQHKINRIPRKKPKL